MWIAILPLWGSNTWHQAAPLQGLHSFSAQDTILVSPSLWGYPPHPSQATHHLDALFTSLGLWHLHQDDLFLRGPSHTPTMALMALHPYYRYLPCLAPCNSFWIDLCRNGRAENGKVEEEVADHQFIFKVNILGCGSIL